MKTHIQTFMKMRLKRLSSERLGIQFFLGPDRDHLQLAGDLNLNIGEWQVFGAALRTGIERHTQVTSDGDTIVPMQVIVEGQMKALGRENELHGRPDVVEYPL